MKVVFMSLIIVGRPSVSPALIDYHHKIIKEYTEWLSQLIAGQGDQAYDPLLLRIFLPGIGVVWLAIDRINPD